MSKIDTRDARIALMHLDSFCQSAVMVDPIGPKSVITKLLDAVDGLNAPPAKERAFIVFHPLAANGDLIELAKQHVQELGFIPVVLDKNPKDNWEEYQRLAIQKLLTCSSFYTIKGFDEYNLCTFHVQVAQSIGLLQIHN